MDKCSHTPRVQPKPLWWHLLDRAYKMMLSAGYRITEQDSDQNDPIGAWMSDVRTFLQTVPASEIDVRALLANVIDHWERVPNDIRSDPGMDNLNGAITDASKELGEITK